jgi:hypothetical protein
MYDGWITMKNQRVYSDITEINDITEKHGKTTRIDLTPGV